MRALNRYVDAKRDQLATDAAKLVNWANSQPQNEGAQRLANAACDAAQAARRLSNDLRYNRRSY